MTLYQQIQQTQAGMEQGLYSVEEYRNILFEIVVNAAIEAEAEDVPHP